MIHNHCKIRADHYWGVGQTTKPSIEVAVKAGFTRRQAVQRLRHCHDAVLLLAGAGWEQVQITLTAEEACWIAEELLAKANEVKARTSVGTRIGSELRAKANKFSKAKRAKLHKRAMKIING